MGKAMYMTLRKASQADAPILYNLILQMATYEKDLDKVQTTMEQVEKTICNGAYAHAFLGEVEGKAVAYTVYYFAYSTYTGRPTLYLEDIYVQPEYRGHGFGKQIMTRLAQLAKEKGCRRFDWSCLEWNAPSIAFYHGLEAEQESGRLHFRLQGEALDKLASLEK